ncbi:unnamed protein product [Porites evermanni]|uniref:Uncharacterized protein n=1 Tax=Porites evermanni TaxID=104178 RepID=A0ABN8SQS3_9CNID|nr:unnamed protein product [Porites evermanni]
MPVTLTSLLTHVKDEVKRGGCAILLVVFKDEAEYEIFTLTTLLNAIKGDNKNAINFGLISKNVLKKLGLNQRQVTFLICFKLAIIKSHLGKCSAILSSPMPPPQRQDVVKCVLK